MTKVSTIDEYIGNQEEKIKSILHEVRLVIRKAAPDAEERMSWQMPTFWQGENLIHFCAHKSSKGAIQFPYNRPVDYELISDITKYRVSCVNKK